MVDHALNHFTMEDDGFMMTGSSKLAPARRRPTPGVSERMGSILSITQVDSIPRKPPATALLDLKRRALFDMAQKRLLTYAGPNTEELEGRYFQWQQSGKQHDKFCLICFYANTNLACRTCKRVYHSLCLNPGWIAEQANGSFFCPLCTKRTWSEEPPSRDLDPERRILALAAQLQNIGAMAVWIQVKDTGEALDDRKLLYKMGAAIKEVAEEAPRDVASRTAPQPETSLNSPDMKQEWLKEEEVEAQSSDEGPSEDPLANEDQLQFVRCVCGRYQLSDDETRDMICCDECDGWQHFDCMGLATHYNPNQYFCELCRPQDHTKLLTARAWGEKPWELVSRYGLALEEPSGGPDLDPSPATPQSDEQSLDIPPLDSAVENAFTCQSPTQSQRQNPPKSKAWPAKQAVGSKKRKRNSPRHNGEVVLRQDDAMKAFRKAESTATQDLYSHNKVSMHIPERLKSSGQIFPPRKPFAALSVALTFALEVPPLNEELSEKNLVKLKKPYQNDPETGQAHRVSDTLLRSLIGSASPEIGTPGQINGASIPESPTEPAAEEDSGPTWQFYQPPTVDTPTIDTPTIDTPTIDTPTIDTPTIDTPTIDTPTIDTPTIDTPTIDTPTIDTPTTETRSTQRPQSGLRRSPVIRPGIARSIPKNLRRARELLGSQEKTMSAILRKMNPSQTDTSNQSFSSLPTTRPPRASTWDLPSTSPSPPQETSHPTTLAIANSILGAQLTSKPAIRELTYHHGSSNRSFWTAVQDVHRNFPEAVNDYTVLCQKLHEHKPWLFPAVNTRPTDHAPTSAGSIPQRKPIPVSTLAVPSFPSASHLQMQSPLSSLSTAPISRPTNPAPTASKAPFHPFAPTSLPSSSAGTDRLLSAQPAISTLVDTYAPLSATTIDVIKRPERLKILAFEYGFLMRQLSDALPREWPKKANRDACTSPDADQAVNGRRAGGRDRNS